MADCECLPTCLFFNDRMQGMDDMVETVKTRLCKGDNEACARFQVYKAIGRENVPKDLYPTQQSRVRVIISEFELQKK